MKKLYLTEKAKCYSNKIVPVKIDDYHDYSVCDFNIENIGNKRKISSQKQHKFFVVILLLFVSLFAFLVAIFPSSSVYNEVNQVVEKLFSPRDFGKIKFTSNKDNENLSEEAFLLVNDFSLPFIVCSSKSVGDTFLVSSAGEITVKCAMKGIVESIETNETDYKKTITVKHAHGLKTVYSMIDTASVKKGDSVEQNTILGIANNRSWIYR